VHYHSLRLVHDLALGADGAGHDLIVSWIQLAGIRPVPAGIRGIAATLISPTHSSTVEPGSARPDRETVPSAAV